MATGKRCQEVTAHGGRVSGGGINRTTRASDFKIAFQYLLGWGVLLSVLAAKCYLYPARFKFCFQIWSC
ncbi:unnamed protein product [Litomosoides sigmodontis]|uniref:Uncharacterized protein n=1 Tax=Litomosoides sigmodontis TaxID=42156 RepID=A0A3P6SP86_LITSI|nr:unnamed protein product [Litomosoides sigmodontis]